MAALLRWRRCSGGEAVDGVGGLENDDEDEKEDGVGLLWLTSSSTDAGVEVVLGATAGGSGGRRRAGAEKT